MDWEATNKILKINRELGFIGPNKRKTSDFPFISVRRCGGVQAPRHLTELTLIMNLPLDHVLVGE